MERKVELLNSAYDALTVKRSKKQQKKYYSKQRRTWGEINPVTRSVPNGKAYNRKKEKERTSKEFRDDGFGAGLFFEKFCCPIN